MYEIEVSSPVERSFRVIGSMITDHKIWFALKVFLVTPHLSSLRRGDRVAATIWSSPNGLMGCTSHRRCLGSATAVISGVSDEEIELLVSRGCYNSGRLTFDELRFVLMRYLSAARILGTQLDMSWDWRRYGF
jgi:hypothetical protein